MNTDKKCTKVRIKYLGSGVHGVFLSQNNKAYSLYGEVYTTEELSRLMEEVSKLKVNGVLKHVSK